MLLGKLTISLEHDTRLDREYGRFLSKDIARQLTEYYRDDMMAFYPSLINVYSVNIISECIGNFHLRSATNRFNFADMAEPIRQFVQKYFPDLKIKYVDFGEATFCDGSASIIYCYKQDDYLIPDSDPHDVMGSENFYNTAQYTYGGRFLPMVKLWCDICQNSNRTMTAFIMPEKKEWPLRKELEYEAFSKEFVKAEVKDLKKVMVPGFRPFNKYYKFLVSDRTMIPITIQPIINQLYNNMQICSRAVYVLDVVDIMKCAQNDNAFFAKISSTLSELKGSTVVIFMDIPNHFLMKRFRNSMETDALQKEKENHKEAQSVVDAEFVSNMNAYNLLDIDDALDFYEKNTLIRELVSSVDKKADKEDQNTDQMKELNKLIYDLIRDMNVMIAYTDTMAYDRDYCFGSLKEMTKKLSVAQIELSSSKLTNDRLTTFGQSIGLSHFGILKGLANKDTINYIGDCVATLVSEKTHKDPTAQLPYDSMFGYRYMVHHSFDYRFSTDAEGNEYFKSFKQQRAKELAEAENLSDEERQKVLERYSTSDFGVINAQTAIHADGSGKFDFFGNPTADKNKYKSAEEVEVELDKMIGLDGIKKQVKQFRSFIEMNKVKEKKGLKPFPISKHMVFMGNPGTAKTTIAQKLGKLLHAAGLIPNSDVKQVSRDDLVGKYVGWTARLVKEAIEEAKGGILFVDEAYSLIAGEGGTNSYGQEAINTFVNYMDKTDVRDSTLIIFAGYKEEMKQFIDSNPGLKSRIGFQFDFPDYTTDELIEIAKVQAEAVEYKLSDQYIEKLRNEIDKCKGAKDFGNGRFVRSIFEKSVLAQSTRLQQMGEDKVKSADFTVEELNTLRGDDFSTKGIDVSSSKKYVGFKSKVQVERPE